MAFVLVQNQLMSPYRFWLYQLSGKEYNRLQWPLFSYKITCLNTGFDFVNSNVMMPYMKWSQFQTNQTMQNLVNHLKKVD